jgi:hypothetical protein
VPGRPLKRDRALLALGFELCALEVADLTETPDGLRVLIRHSKTDQEGQGAEVAILRGCRLRPVEALQAWLAARSTAGRWALALHPPVGCETANLPKGCSWRTFIEQVRAGRTTRDDAAAAARLSAAGTGRLTITSATKCQIVEGKMADPY